MTLFVVYDSKLVSLVDPFWGTRHFDRGFETMEVMSAEWKKERMGKDSLFLEEEEKEHHGARTNIFGQA